MKVKITQSFAEVNTVAFRPGEELDVPDSLAREWIFLRRAVSVEDKTVPNPDPKTATPKTQQAERAVKPKPETRGRSRSK